MKYILISLASLLLIISIYSLFFEKNTIQYPSIYTSSDKDGDGINDIEDLILAARSEVNNKTLYQDGYFAWGYPPTGQWVCTDMIWRAFKAAWYNIKDLIDADIAQYPTDYPRVWWTPEPNIDFRRVPNLNVFFSKYALSLTTQIIPNKQDNLVEWQAGDIIVFDSPNQHIAIISDTRDKNGVPLLIHNYSDYAREDNWVIYDTPEQFPIIGHYRIKYWNL